LQPLAQQHAKLVGIQHAGGSITAFWWQYYSMPVTVLRHAGDSITACRWQYYIIPVATRCKNNNQGLEMY